MACLDEKMSEYRAIKDAEKARRAELDEHVAKITDKIRRGEVQVGQPKIRRPCARTPTECVMCLLVVQELLPSPFGAGADAFADVDMVGPDDEAAEGRAGRRMPKYRTGVPSSYRRTQNDRYR